MQTGRTLQGTHIDAVGSYFLQISDCRIYELLCHYLTVASNYLSDNVPQIFILWSSIRLTAAQNLK